MLFFIRDTIMKTPRSSKNCSKKCRQIFRVSVQ